MTKLKCETCGERHDLKLTCLQAWTVEKQEASTKGKGEIVEPRAN